MAPFLLLQARRPLDPMRDHEHGCFADAMGLDRDELRTLDVVRNAPTAGDAQGCLAVLIGGSGNFSARTEDPWLLDTMVWLREHVVAPGKPMFAVCFGIQVLGRALGVDVIHDPENREVGTYTIRTTEHVHGCPIFGRLPATFLAQQGHNDRLVRLPPGTVQLATNDNALVQALRVQGKPIWATQFHPELTRKDNATRYQRYIEGYGGPLPTDADDPVLASLRDTPHSTMLLRRFGELVLKGTI